MFPVKTRRWLAIVAGLVLVNCAVRAAEPAGKPLVAREELKTLRLADPALTIELVAAEPDIISPVAVAWDEEGRMYVAEMIDYPVSPAAGRIKRLEDRDGDGAYERVTTFADGLPYPTSVLPWNGGVLVTAAPNIWFFKDRDGDGRADERTILFTGFVEGNQQLRVNGLSYGLDNWVYGANGRSDGDVRRPDDASAKSIPLRRHDFRFRPATREFEAVAGFSQFGLPRDDWGNRFPSWNTIPIRHVVLEDAVLSRNPYLAESSTVAAILDSADGGRVYSISAAPQQFNRESAAFFNASCGPTIYRGDALGKDYPGNAFVCEPLTNLVHRRVLFADGPTFTARRVEQGKEFLASTDPAFRPVNLATGPDGALYVVDFYRELVEHPQFVPENIRGTVEFRRWFDRGRLWRIRAKDRRERSTPPRLSGASSRELVALFDRTNGWWRDTAQRLLVERQDRGAVGALTEALNDGANPLTRLHALWTLEGLMALTEPMVRRALRDESPGVRASAVRLATAMPALEPELVALANDADVRVRFQAVIALGGHKDEAAVNALADVAERDAADPWMRLAIVSGLGETASPFLKRLLTKHPGWQNDPTPDQEMLLARVAEILGASGRRAEMNELVARLSFAAGSNPWAVLSGLVDGMGRVQSRAPETPGAHQSSLVSEAIVAQATRTALSEKEPPSRRALAMNVAIRTQPRSVLARLGDLLQPGEPAVVQSAATRALIIAGGPDDAAKVLDRWNEYGSTTRRELITALTSRAALAESLVKAIEREQVNPAELDAAARDALQRVRDPALHARIVPILAKASPPDRAGVLRKYQAVLKTEGDARRGEALFAKNCQACHQKRGKGHRVGPDLSGVAGRPAFALLNDILDPSREVAPDYVAFVLVNRQGQTISGLLAEETGTTLKLRRNEGVEETVLRSEIEEFRSTGRSLMPEGLEQTLSVQDVADVIAYLRTP
jgi:putative membrane-bound dehydrogenase-like protein